MYAEEIAHLDIHNIVKIQKRTTQLSKDSFSTSLELFRKNSEGVLTKIEICLFHNTKELDFETKKDGMW